LADEKLDLTAGLPSQNGIGLGVGGQPVLRT